MVRIMTKKELIEHCLSYPGSYEDYPFDEEWAVIRHQNNKKAFALIYEREARLCVNLKCEPMRADFLRGLYEDVKPAYHMNKTHWNTVYADGTLPEEELFLMIDHSFSLTAKKPRLKAKYAGSLGEKANWEKDQPKI